MLTLSSSPKFPRGNPLPLCEHHRETAQTICPPSEVVNRYLKCSISLTASSAIIKLDEDNGATYEFSVPVPEDHELIKPIEEFRLRVGIEPFGYVLGTLDNTEGKERAFIGSISVISEDGQTLTFATVRTNALTPF